MPYAVDPIAAQATSDTALMLEIVHCETALEQLAAAPAGHAVKGKSLLKDVRAAANGEPRLVAERDQLATLKADAQQLMMSKLTADHHARRVAELRSDLRGLLNLVGSAAPAKRSRHDAADTIELPFD